MVANRLFVGGGLLAIFALGFGLIANRCSPKSTVQSQLGRPKAAVTELRTDVVRSSLPFAKALEPALPLTEAVLPLRGALPGQAAMMPPSITGLSAQERSPLADRLGMRTLLSTQEAGVVLDVLNAYRRTFGVFPAGEDNRQIVNALLGANAQKLAFVPADHPRLNASGELVDAWATPFFFHLLSSNHIEVRSAGPDRAMYTADDIVAGSPPPRRTDLEQR